MTGIILAKKAGQASADADGICASQSLVAGTLTINGSLTSGGAWENPGWGWKLKAITGGDASANSLTITGKFWASASAGAYTNTVTLDLVNAGTATTTLFATAVDSVVAATSSVGAITLGTDGEGEGVPVIMKHGAMYAINYGGTFGGATVQLKKYHALTSEWLPFDGETGETTGTVINYQMPSGTTIKSFLTSGSTTTAIGISADVINPT